MSNQHTVTIERTINAPIARVWAAWTKPAQVQQWWGPIGFTIPACQWDVQPGGKIDLVMLAGADLGPMAGQEFPMTGEFIEVEEPNRLVYTSNAIMEGKVVLTNRSTVTFTAVGDTTKLELISEVIMSTPEAEGPLAGMAIGLNQTVDKLVAFAETKV